MVEGAAGGGGGGAALPGGPTGTRGWREGVHQSTFALVEHVMLSRQLKKNIV